MMSIQNEYYEAERKTLFRKLKQKMRFKKNTETELIKIVQVFEQDMDIVISQRSKKIINMACRSGCAYCCHQMVGVTPLEVFFIADAINHRYAEQKQEILQRLSHNAEYVESTWDEPPVYNRACSFLVDNTCGIYAARPSGCRKAHSLDVSDCEAFFLQQSAVAVPGDEQLEQRCLGLRKGFQQAIAELHLDVEPVDMQHSVYMALIYPDLLSRWLNGERVFPMQITANGRFYNPTVLNS